MTKRVSKSLDAHRKKGRLGHFYRTMEQKYAYKRTIFNEKNATQTRRNGKKALILHTVTKKGDGYRLTKH